MSRDKKNQNGDYDVGKYKPPIEHRWKKGQSGNPKGRPKAQKPEQIDVADILNRPVKARVGGKRKKIPGFEASLRQVAKKALGGDLPSIKQFLKICEDYGVIVPPEPEQGGGVVVAPKGVDLHDWIEKVTELVPADKA